MNQEETRKHVLSQAQRNGVLDRVHQLLSAAHILMYVANELVEEADTTLQQNHMRMGILKQHFKKMVKFADLYFECFAKTVPNDIKSKEMFRDMDQYKILLMNHFGLKKKDEIEEKEG